MERDQIFRRLEDNRIAFSEYLKKSKAADDEYQEAFKEIGGEANPSYIEKMIELGREFERLSEEYRELKEELKKLIEQ